MSMPVVVLQGTAGMVEGERFILPEGVEIVVGRSRGCPISLRRVANYLRASASVRDGDHDFNTVSRRHVRLLVMGAKIDIEDLSSNGTTVGDEALKGKITVDLAIGPTVLRLGTRERFAIQLMASDDPRLAGLTPVSPMVGGGDD